MESILWGNPTREMSLRIGVDVSAGLFLGAGQYLIASTPGAKYGESFAAEAMSELEGLRNIPGRRRGGQVDRL